MKYKIKRFMAVLLAIVTIFTTFFSNITVSFAASASANISFWYASVKDVGVVSELKAGFDHGKVLYAMLDGHSAYCMNYGLSADGGQLMNSYSNPSTNLSAKQEKLLNYCLYYGFSSTSTSQPSDAQSNKFIATQAIVWIIEANIFGTASGDSAAKKLCASASDASASYSYYTSVRDNIKKSYDAVVPSFATRNKSDAKTYELKWNESNNRFETTLTDSNKILSDYDFSISGFSVAKSGNNLTVYTKSVNTTATLGTLKSTVGAVDTITSCVYWLTGKAGYQEFISERPQADPISAYIKVKTENAGYGKITKKDAGTGVKLQGAVYGIYSDSKCTKLVDKVTTDVAGSAKTKALVEGTYYVKEISAPKGYVISKKVITLNITVGKTTSISATDKEQRGAIILNKVDKENEEAVPHGDATLQGAVYGLYAREDIVHPDGETGIIYKAGELINKLTTDEEGQAEIKNLYLGNYYVKEIEPSEGYLLDTNEYNVNCNYEGDTVVEIERNITSKEQVIKQPFQIIKVADDGEETEAELLKGAGFTVYLKSSLRTKSDGSYDFENATPVVIGNNGETTLYTDEKGYLVTTPIPYGTYVVVETFTPHNLKTIKPFEVKITKNNPSEPQRWRVFLDREFNAKLRIIKKDADTEKTVLIPNTEFKIYNLDKNEYVKMITTYPSKKTHTSFFTDEDGDLILPEPLKIGNYRVEEVAAPYGYVLNTNYIEVAVDTNTCYEVDLDTDDAIITVEYKDNTAVGELTVEKKGEVLVDYITNEVNKGHFIYETRGIKGAIYKVYAAEDIYTADMQLDDRGNRTKYYSKGELVATLETNDDGKATISKLPLGKYKVVEDTAPNGFVINSEPQEVTFEYVDDKTPVIRESISFTNDRQKMDLSIIKKDSEDERAIQGAEFGLYAVEDIENIDGKVIVKSGTLLEKTLSDENGKVSFINDYPFAKYEAREIKAPAGYVSSEEVVAYDTKYQGQDVKVAEYSSEFINIPTTFQFTKSDITSGVELSGATLTVYDKDGNVVDTWISEAENPHIIKRLVVGETYTLKEELAPYGYLQAEEIQFEVEDTAEIQKVEMKDEVPTGTIAITKDGEFLKDVSKVNNELVAKMLSTLYNPIIDKTDKWFDLNFNYSKSPLSGVTFNVYAREDVVSPDGLNAVYYKANELVATIETNECGIAIIEKLPLGKYYVVETKTLEGFVLDFKEIEADLSYMDQYTEVVYAGMNITNERQKVNITINKIDGNTNKPLKGGIFGLYAKKDIVNKDGQVVVKADELIESSVSNAKGKAVFKADLPLGLYYVKEIQAPSGYVKSDKVFDIDATYKNDKKELVFETEYKNYPKVVMKDEVLKGKVVSDTPKTGDNSNVWMYCGICMLSLVVMIFVHVLRRKRGNV